MRITFDNQIKTASKYSCVFLMTNDNYTVCWWTLKTISCLKYCKLNPLLVFVNNCVKHNSVDINCTQKQCIVNNFIA